MQEVTAAQQQGRSALPVPGETNIVLLSFEGPDQYARRGIVGGYVSGLGHAFADAGFATTIVFVGDPDAPREEELAQTGTGALRLVRWGQWISRYYPDGPYEDEDARVLDFAEGVPAYIADLSEAHLREQTSQSAAPGLVVIACEWQTSQALQGLHDELLRRGLRHRAVLIWHMGHILNLGHVDLAAVARTSAITTVSRYLKHELWKHGQDPLILPPGVDDRHFDSAPADVQAGISALAGSRPLLFAPVLPPTRSSAIYGALATLRNAGIRPLLVLGHPPDDDTVAAASQHRFSVTAQGELRMPSTVPDADLLFPSEPLPEVAIRAFYEVALATLLVDHGDATATSLLQAMAGRAVVVADNAMHDPLIPFANGVALETTHPAEVVATLIELLRNPESLASIRINARRTAAGYAWPHTLASVLVKVAFLAGRQPG